MVLDAITTRSALGSCGTILLILAAIMGCSHNARQDSADVAARDSEHVHDGSGEHRQRKGSEHVRGERGEHDRDGVSHHGHGEAGEESGTELTLKETYDKVRNGARLILAYDAASNSFQGTVENTTDTTLEGVRVEVHLSNGKELGPTTPGDLKPGESREVTLFAESQGFDGWTAHPEVGSEEHGHGEGGEHGQREAGEHRRGEG